MWANDFRLGSSWFHFWTLRPNPMELVSTARLCHITPSASGTSPSIFRLNRFKRYPYGPVISALGIRVVLAMRAPHCRCDRHQDTACTESVTVTGIRSPTRPVPEDWAGGSRSSVRIAGCELV